MLNDFGYGYDEEKNLFYTLVHAWQRKYGYCRLYDEACGPSGMIIHCEPFYFESGGEQFMLELWKGQYGMTTGCEIGLYRDSGKQLLSSPWFESVRDDEMVLMDMTLYKNGKILFQRAQRHWWLTGFLLAEFSKLKELSLSATIQFNSEEMALAFWQSAAQTGYGEHELAINGGTVWIYFAKPKTKQPVTNIKPLVDFTQAKNKLLCQGFREISGGRTDMYEILADVKQNYPDFFESLMQIGRSAEGYTAKIRELPEFE
ncbi:MAG: DUF4474 domain-containing protein [Oscillospiraceae bacterium]|nr:DUF4474 domain-containing protein [Oscillospiraceae bacterium]